MSAQEAADTSTDFMGARVPKKQSDWKEQAVGLVVEVLGPPLKELSGALTDRLTYYRAKNLVNIMGKARKIVDDANVEKKEISLKTLVPMLEAASLEDSPDLQEKWASLLATSSEKGGVHPGYTQILRGLTSSEVKLLDALFDGFESQKDASLFCESPYDAFSGPILDPYHVWEDLIAEGIVEAKRGKTGVNWSELEEALDNIFRAGLINLMPAAVPYDEEILHKHKGPAINNRNYNNATLTHLGCAFVLACKGPGFQGSIWERVRKHKSA